MIDLGLQICGTLYCKCLAIKQLIIDLLNFAYITAATYCLLIFVTLYIFTVSFYVYVTDTDLLC